MRRSSCCAIRSCAAGRSSSAAAADTSRRLRADGTRELLGRCATTPAAASSRPAPTRRGSSACFSAMGMMKSAALAPDAVLLPVDFDEYRKYSRLFKAAVREHRAGRRGPRHRRDLHRPERRARRARRRRPRASARALKDAVRERDRPDLLDRHHAEQAAVEDRLRARQARRPDAARATPTSRRGSGRCRRARSTASARRRRRSWRRSASHTIGDVAAAEPAFLLAALRQELRRLAARGVARPRRARRSSPSSEPKSISRETTFDRDLHAVRDRAELGAIFTELCEQLAGDLARKGYAGKTIGIKLRFDDFKIVDARPDPAGAHARRARHPPRRRQLPEAGRPDAAPAPARRARRRARDAWPSWSRRCRRAAERAPRARARAAGRQRRPAALRRRVADALGCRRRRRRHRRRGRSIRTARLDPMPVITHIEDLRVLAEAARAAHVLRLRRLRLVDREHLPRQRGRLPDASSCASASPSTWRTARCARRWSASTTAMPVAIAPTGLTGMQHADGEILAARAAEKFGIPFTLSDDEHLLDRGHRRAHQGAVLVPALHDARPRLHGAPDRARAGGALQRAGPDARPADPRPAPQGPEERPDRAAEADAREPAQPRDQAALVPRHARHQAAQLRQHRRPRQGRRRPCVARSPGPRSSSIRR